MKQVRTSPPETVMTVVTTVGEAYIRVADSVVIIDAELPPGVHGAEAVVGAGTVHLGN